ncbi:MAG: plastocyanin/azurin family copper-binding protein [Sulfurimonas sp.]
MKKTLKILLVSLALAASVSAADHVVNQKGKTFLPAKMTVSVGDTITFKNSDPFAHNAYTDNEANEFDVGMQPTGKVTTMTVKAKESFNIECAIHPNMLIEVEVK